MRPFRWLVTSLVLAFSASLVHGQSSLKHTPSPKGASPHPFAIPVVAYWETGDRRDVVVVQGERRFFEGELVSADSSTTHFRVVVTETGDEYYRVRWFLDDYLSTETYEDDSFLFDEATLMRIESEGLLVRTDDLGAFVEIENARLYRRLFEELIESFIMNARENEGADEARVQNMRRVFDTLGGADHVLNKYIEPIRHFYKRHGYEWQVSPARSYEDLLSLAGPGAPVPVRGKVEIVDFDEVAGTFVLVDRMWADRVAMGRGVAQFLVESGAIDASEESAMAEVGIRLEDVERVHVDAMEGWVIDLDRLRVIEAAGDRREQFLRITSRVP